MTSVPALPAERWGQIPPAAQAGMLPLVQRSEGRLPASQDHIDDLRRQGRNVLDFLTACCQGPLQGRSTPSLLPQGT